MDLVRMYICTGTVGTIILASITMFREYPYGSVKKANVPGV